ncbi:DUF5304 family protein [Streptacidiphilus griseoplanus]|uniref:DUF5304 family protein n=1 Tax=Peterkaempfera griseoplana TaxID=66896 RepID=UPI0006E1A18C|nr:DUF5304 family protein [Peterkaempfera griseoplana]
MSSADDRREGEDVWARVVAEDAAAQAAAQREAAEPEQQAGREEKESRAGEDPFGGGGGAEDPLGSQLGPLVEEVRRFASAVGERMQEATRALGAGEGLDRLAGPVREKHPEVYRHLAAAGGELLAAYRAAVSGHERRWTTERNSGSERIDLD